MLLIDVLSIYRQYQTNNQKVNIIDSIKNIPDEKQEIQEKPKTKPQNIASEPMNNIPVEIEEIQEKPKTEPQNIAPVVTDKVVKSFSNNLNMTFILIKSGTFMMGSPPEEPEREDDEHQHQVTLSKDYYMQTTEVTQGQWKAIMGNNPSRFENCGDKCPVEQVSWDDVQQFIKNINKAKGDYIYRLPTEAEWEYAARAGTKTALYNGEIEIIGTNNAPALDPIAWYGGNSCVKYSGGYNCNWSDKQYTCSKCGPHPVAQKIPNPWGLYDMIGNVWEWCSDWYGEYPTNHVIDPQGVKSATSRLLRGGAWFYDAWFCRSANRSRFEPGDRSIRVGFRLAASLSSAKEK